MAAAAVPDAGAREGRYALASGAERIVLTGVSPGAVDVSKALSIDPLDARIEVKVGKPGKDAAVARVADALRPGLVGLCRTVEAQRGALVFGCETRRIDARLFVEAGRLTLEVYELRGLPYRGEGQVLAVPYPPQLLGLGAACPGDTPSSRGECAWAAGDTNAAEVQLRLGLDGDTRSYAAVRLGDIALSRGDAVAAFGWYRKASAISVFGRVAAGRMCLLGGTCLDDPQTRVWNTTSLEEPLRMELIFAHARVAAYLDRPAEVVAAMRDALASPGAVSLCTGSGVAYCRRLILYAIERAPAADAADAIELYLQLPGRTMGPLAFRLGIATADRAAKIGAPIFAANVMAAISAMVPEDDQLPHLLRTAELYLMGDDRARSRAIVEYVDSRYTRKQTMGARWAAVRKDIARLGEDGAIKPDTAPSLEIMSAEAARDVAAAWSALSRVRTEKR